MDLVFRYRMLSDESDHFVRDLEVMPEMTLTEFHRFVFEALGYDEAMVSIFASDEMWKRQQEYTQIDMGGDAASAPKSMDSVRLLEVTDRLHGRMIYVFDMLNDRALYLELVEVKRPEAGMKYPRVAFEHASAPDQYDPEATVDEGSIFEEMMGDYGDFDGDDSYDDEI
ncbi:hypothetical protein IMSAGC022_00256 [Alistipes sp.]|nr:hypothetical protein IMSAGC022_00256 [Alistipes sp.]